MCNPQMPSMFRLIVETGNGSDALVDAVGLALRAMAALPTVPAAWGAQVGAPGALVTAPEFELAKMYSMVDSAFRMDAADVDRRLARLAALERHALPRIRSASSRAPNSAPAPAPAVHPFVAAALARQPGLRADVCLLLLDGGGAAAAAAAAAATDVVVPDTSAARVLIELARAAGDGGRVAVYAAAGYVLHSYALVFELACRPGRAAGGSVPPLLLFASVKPVPARDAGGPCLVAPPRFTMSHVYMSSLWCTTIGDAAGARARMAAFRALAARWRAALAAEAVSGSVSATYVGADEAHPVDTLKARSALRRSRGRPMPSCVIRVSPHKVEGPLSPRSPLVDAGRPLATLAARDVARMSPAGLAAALAAARVPDTILTDPLLHPSSSFSGRSAPAKP
jgi:hypothetical protein